MKEYELLFIVSPRVPADDVPAAIDRVTALVQSAGGEILNVDNWGRRRLAYPIRHYFEGTYVLLALRMEPSAAAPLEASLIISEEVIRHLLTEGIIPQVNRDRGPSAFEDRDRDRGPAPIAAAPAPAEAAVAVAEPEAPAAAVETTPAESAAPESAAPEPVAPEPAATEAVAAEAESTDAAPEAATDPETAATEPAPAANE